MKQLTPREAVQALRTWLHGSVLAYIVGLFVFSRILYVCLGDVVARVFGQYMPPSMAAYSVEISKHSAVQMWYVWDAVHYGNLARLYDWSLSALPAAATEGGRHAYYLLHWFPLYPLLGWLLHEATRISVPFCLLIISNAAFLGSLYMLYKLVRFDGGDDGFARKVVALLVLLPASFLFSAALSESLFLFLALLALYLARRERWLLAGGAAFLLALTHSRGFLIAVPLIVEAYQQYGLTPHRLADKLRPYVRPVLACVLAGLGVVAFVAYGWLRTGSLTAYADSQHIGNGVGLNDPFTYLLHNLFKLRTLILLGELSLVVLVWRNLRWSYIAYTLVFMLAALAIGESTAASMLRYASVVFPVAIAAGYLTERKNAASFVWSGLGIVQGALFVLWVVWWTGFII